MQKKNKILMMAVSSLLCLTLISSCLVSSVFAKYVTTDTATATAVIEKFGVTLSVSSPISSLSAEEKTQRGLDGVTVTDNSTINMKTVGVYSITVSGLKMGPGDKIDEMIHFNFDGVANVHCRLSIDAIVEFEKNNTDDKNNFYIPSGVGISTGKHYFPIQVLCNADRNGDGDRKDTSPLETLNCLTQWQSVTPDTINDDGSITQGSASSTVCRILAQYFDLSVTPNDKNEKGELKYYTQHVYKDFSPKDEIFLYTRTSKSYTGELDKNVKVHDLYFGLNYPITYKKGDVDNTSEYDEMATYLQEARDATFSITFVFTIEQTS